MAVFCYRKGGIWVICSFLDDLEALPFRRNAYGEE
jgi:hypothetical protein